MFSALKVYGLVVRVVPVEVGNGFLHAEEVVDCVHDDVDSGGVACLCA